MRRLVASELIINYELYDMNSIRIFGDIKQYNYSLIYKFNQDCSSWVLLYGYVAKKSVVSDTTKKKIIEEIESHLPKILVSDNIISLKLDYIFNSINDIKMELEEINSKLRRNDI